MNGHMPSEMQSQVWNWNATSRVHCASCMCWQKRSHVALRNGFSEEYPPPLRPSCNVVSYAGAHWPLRVLQTEITHNFQYTDIQAVAGWLSFVTRKGARAITEVDCQKQFDNIHPRDMTRAFGKATKWLTKKRRWRQQELH